MKTITIFLVGIGVVCSLRLASANASGDYEMKHKSSFDQKVVKRNPFIPIGYVEQAKGPVADVPSLEINPKDYLLTAILSGTATIPPYAVINGMDYTIGDRVRNASGGLSDVFVTEIRDGYIILRTKTDKKVIPLERDLPTSAKDPKPSN